MSKDAKFIGSTPDHLSRAANDLALKQFAENNKKLIENIARIQKNMISGGSHQPKFAEK
jgi:hypothetical protein